MHRILKDTDGKVVKAHIPTGGSVPSGYTDVTDSLQIDADTEGLSMDLLELEYVPAVGAVEAQPEHWTDGTTVVHDANDIPTLTDENGDPYLDPAFVHVDAVPAVEGTPAYHRLKKKATADQSMRESKMQMLRLKREALLADADIEINKIEDASGDSTAMRAYRQALRDVTETYKKVDGDWKVAVDSIDVDTFEFPAKP